MTAAPWPFVPEPGVPLPATLPGGARWPRISIVTPSFNQGAYLEETILSVLNQGYPDVEHIVMDGGSTDATREILERYRGRLAAAVSEKDDGQGDALNKGFRKATGEILTWLNSDDRLAPGALAAVALAFHTSGADMVAGICELWRDGELLAQHLHIVRGRPAAARRPPRPGRLLERRAVLLPARGLLLALALGEDRRARGPSVHYSMDYELWLRFAEAGARLHVIGRPVAQFRMHPDQKTHAVEAFKAELPRVVEAFLGRTARPRPAPRAAARTDRLRVTFFNDIGVKHGAGIAHGRLAEAVALAGHEVTLLAAGPENVPTDLPTTTTAVLLDRLAATRPDLVVVGNLHAASLPPSLLGLVADRWPTAFVAHDLWIFTGRCAYTGSCEKYAAGCDETCPTASEYPPLSPDRIHAAWKAKRRILTGRDAPVVLCNSRWTLGFGRSVFAQGVPGAKNLPRQPAMDWIRLAFPLDLFRPRDKEACRELLGLPRDAFLVLFSATSLRDPRKGVSHLAQAVRSLDLLDLELVCVGWVDPRDELGYPRVRTVGFIGEPERLAALYSAMDLFVGPSFEEGFGQVFVEAAACGTPSVGYPVGGVPEAVVDGVTGVLAKSVDPSALAEAIRKVYDDRTLRRDMAAWARIHVENEWSSAAAYHRLHAALSATGLRDRLGLSRKISFATDVSRTRQTLYAESVSPPWRPLDGFGHWEGPYPQWDLPLCRWMLGPVGRFEALAGAAGRHRLIVACRNFLPGQRARLVCQGSVLLETDVPVSSQVSGTVLECDVELPSGPAAFELHAWKWSTAPGERPMSLLVAGVSLLLEKAVLPGEAGG